MKRTIAITGVTGLLGRNILFEYLRIYLNDLSKTKFILFGRSTKTISFKNRVIQLLNDDGIYYLNISQSKLKLLINELNDLIEFIEIDFGNTTLNNSVDLNKLKKNNIDVFYHAAANTNLNNNNTIRNLIEMSNIEGTKIILNLVDSLKVKRFCYFSSAYSTGKLKNRVSPDHISLERNFRNPYEYSKQFCEYLVRNYKFKKNTASFIFRTSILGGRLMEKKIGQIHKFDTFYGLSSFFLKTKESFTLEDEDIYKKQVSLNIRVLSNKNAKVNIIPADYAAKAVIDIMSSEYVAYNSFHLVNEKEVDILEQIFKYLNIVGCKLVQTFPDNLNKLEILYYKSVGNIFTPYLDNEGIHYFDITTLKNSLSPNIQCPALSDDHFKLLFDYAKEYDFGIRLSKK